MTRLVAGPASETMPFSPPGEAVGEYVGRARDADQEAEEAARRWL